MFITLNDDADVSGCAPAPARSVVEFCTVEGERYRIYVHGRFADSAGQYELTVTSSMDDCPPCPCDRNGDRVQNVGDYFDGLTEFFDQLGGPGSADIDGDCVVTVGDYFVFLGCLPVIATNTQCP